LAQAILVHSLPTFPQEILCSAMSRAPMFVDVPDKAASTETSATAVSGSETSSKSQTSEDWILVDKDKTGAQAGLDKDAELDLCFICDCTGSMGAYIKAAQENIQSIVSQISQSQGAKVRFGLISYRDHPPQDQTYVTQCHPFTNDLARMSEYVNTMKAQGGGDGPEAVTAGLHDALHLPWRPNATKICVLIADAPPHGLEPTGDGFPNGDPEGRDPLDILRNMAARDITVYTVGCEPALGSYAFARDFLCTVAELTGGQAVALSSAAMLADVIINGSAEELGLAKLQWKVEEEVQKIQVEARSAGRDISAEVAVTMACTSLQAQGMKSVQMETDGLMTNATRDAWGLGARERKSLASVKAELGSKAPAPRLQGLGFGAMPAGRTATSAAAPFPPRFSPAYAPASAPAPVSAPSAPASRNVLKEDLISHSQVGRIMQKAQCQNRLL